LFSTTTVADGLANFRAETIKEIAGASRFLLKHKGKDDMKRRRNLVGESPNMLMMMMDKTKILLFHMR
jgi:hypothetical protein